MDINTALAGLARVTGSAEFSALREARKKVKGNPANYKLLTDFETKRDRLNSASISPADAERLMGELQRDYQSIGSNPDINAYFAAAGSFDVVMSDAMNNFQKTIDSLIKQ